MLQEKGSPIDLMLRGFDRGVVLECTGVDIGYNGRALREAAAGTDRLAYKAAHVAEREGLDVARSALAAYAAGASKTGVLAMLGIAGENVVKLKELYALLDLGEEFAEADKQARHSKMKQGMLAKHGVENPFELAEFQEKAGDTREAKYGARYTLATGSSLEGAARASTSRTVRRRNGFQLFEKGSPADLSLRGFGHTEIFEATGVEIGRNGQGIRSVVHGIGRLAYKIEHVLARVESQHREAVLRGYRDGDGRTVVLHGLGLGTGVVSLSKLFAGIGMGGAFREADRHHKREAMRRGMRAKHGVDHFSQTPEFSERMSTWFAENQDEILAGFREGTLAKYGVEHHSQRPERRDAMAQLMRETGSERAVVARTTSLQRYGVEHHSQTEESRQQRSAFLKLNPLALQESTRRTLLARYGVEHAWLIPGRYARMQQTMLDRYGVDTAQLIPGVREKTRQTCLDCYGVAHPAQTAERKAMMSERMSSPVMRSRVAATKRRNGTFNASTVEQRLHGLLVERFGADDVLVQHRDEERYPWACDFYIPSRDLFVELNGTWTHGGHWYDEDSGEDRAKLAAWGRKDTAFYRNAVVNWSVRDVAKRERARQERLNYVVLWDGREAMEDVLLWLELGAPDGADWDREHSWLPARQLDLDLRGKGFPAALDGRVGNAREAARAANWRTFYERELALWDADAPSARGRTQGELYANRLHHLGKAPSRLSDFEALNGLSISGRLRKYTTFDNSGMVRALEQYGTKSVYDPCAGWGERLATCAGLGIEYFGVDISAAVVEGHQRIVEQYGLTEQRTEQGDAALAYRRQGLHDTVFTCPPYGDAEIYTEDGAENLDEQGFLAWWADVVHMSTGTATETFAYQINQKWKERMNQVLEEHGWSFVDQIAVGTGNISHFNRTKGGGVTKREFEEVQVFRR